VSDTQFDWSSVLSELAAGRELEPDLARAALDSILAGNATAAQIGGFLLGLRVKGETPAEVSAFIDAMLDNAAELDLGVEGVVDIVGTGGAPRRREGALNVSTAASFVAAASGVVVCKHGNRKASSTSGSTDVLDALGVPIELDGADLARCVSTLGLGFAFARVFHPAMRFAGPVRSELGIPTVFNILGPLSHPGRVDRAVIGVGDPSRFDLVAETLRRREPAHMWVVYGTDGVDELSTSAPSRVAEIRGPLRRDFDFDPATAGIAAPAVPVRGGDPELNAQIIEGVLAGESSPEADIVALNAAAAILVAGLEDDIAAALLRAREALGSGGAAAKLQALREFV
jgi:anthranilate phosphoribosyltransferase